MARTAENMQHCDSDLNANGNNNNFKDEDKNNTEMCIEAIGSPPPHIAR